MNEAQLEKNGLMLEKYLQMLIKEITKNQSPKIYHKNHKQVSWTSTKNQIIIRKVNSLKEFLFWKTYNITWFNSIKVEPDILIWTIGNKGQARMN